MTAVAQIVHARMEDIYMSYELNDDKGVCTVSNMSQLKDTARTGM